MGIARFVSRIAVPLVVLAALVGIASLAGSHRSSLAQVGIPRETRLALADLDGDNLTDKAELGGTGLNKNIQLRLSRTGKFSVLTFDTASLDRGSLLAQDVNDDGEVDLIWTDLVHPDAVVIWLNTGLGRFERASATGYGDRFTIGSFKFDQPFNANDETSIGLSRVSFDELLAPEKPSGDYPAPRLCCRSLATASYCIASSGPPTDRAPPSV